MKQIPLTQGKVALVDDADFEHLNQWKYFAVTSRSKWYAARKLPKTLGKRRMAFMHNDIMQPPPGIEVDHRDRDGLNNQRFNLRYATHAQNTMNRKRRSDNTSGYKGVSRNGSGWLAKLTVKGKPVLQKTFRSPEEAARAYNKSAREHQGEFAQTNSEE